MPHDVDATAQWRVDMNSIPTTEVVGRRGWWRCAIGGSSVHQMMLYVPSDLVTTGRAFLLSLGEDILELAGDELLEGLVAAAIIRGDVVVLDVNGSPVVVLRSFNHLA